MPALRALNQNLSKSHMRATAATIMLFIVNIIGAGARPLLVGVLKDFSAPHYGGGGEAIRYSLPSRGPA